MRPKTAVFAVVLASVMALLASLALSQAADAKPRPGPTITTKYYRTSSGPVIIDAAPEAASASLYAVNFWNQHTNTGFLCAADTNGNCDHIACPDMNLCLAIRMGNLGLGGPDASLRMFGPKKAVLTLNTLGPLYNPDLGNPYTPWHRGAMVTHWVGRFIGLSTNPAGCVTVMTYRSWLCPPPRPGEVWLTPSEQLQAAAW